VLVPVPHETTYAQLGKEEGEGAAGALTDPESKRNSQTTGKDEDMSDPKIVLLLQ
jgi:hypothetical protein